MRYYTTLFEPFTLVILQQQASSRTTAIIMDAALLGQLIAVQSAAPPREDTMPLRPPQKSITKTYAAVPQRDSTEIELARVSRPLTLSRSSTSGLPSDNDNQAIVPDLERSRTSSPSSGLMDPDGVEALQSWSNPYMNRFRFLSACSLNLMNGMNDAAAGPLIPYMEK